MDTGQLKILELALIVGVVGYFYLRQRQNLQRLKDAREAKQGSSVAQGDDDKPATPRDETSG